MKMLFLKAIIFFIGAGLVCAPVLEAAYAASISKDCACCKAKCPTSAKCHDTPQVCLCSHQVAQVILKEGVIFLKPDLSGYMPPAPQITYNHPSAKGIFHPPNLP